ncbi:vacuolar protein sorting-associated protein 52 A-like [Quercus lobata]|uniref:vacuolar protein sorting-associated protein 52 A-like n=1 Tax=Quercus lobata TaxID=97700 RepID=UPI00124836D9|nr:vacuolar protein sorting-associated protein 52 A-like [Quercus lobata]
MSNLDIMNHIYATHVHGDEKFDVESLFVLVENILKRATLIVDHVALVVANILFEGTKLREYTKGVENNLRKVELDSIQDYIKESDNLVLLHDQIRECDRILSQMETLLSGFQVEIGSISSDIKVLQEKSMDMGLKLKNRKINDEYMRTLEILSKKLKFVEVDPMVKASKALKDVQPELEKVRQNNLQSIQFLVHH